MFLSQNSCNSVLSADKVGDVNESSHTIKILFRRMK